jgi:hypothetical protein
MLPVVVMVREMNLKLIKNQIKVVSWKCFYSLSFDFENLWVSEAQLFLLR